MENALDVIDLGEGNAEITSILVNEDEDKIEMEITLVLTIEIYKPKK